MKVNITYISWSSNFALYPDIFSPVKLCGNPKQIATEMIFAFLNKINIQIKHIKSRTKSENMKFDFFCMFDGHELAC